MYRLELVNQTTLGRELKMDQYLCEARATTVLFQVQCAFDLAKKKPFNIKF